MDDRERSLAQAIEGLLDSYRSHGNINHLEATALPSRHRVTKLLDQLMYLVFPGYFDEENLDELLSTYVVGERCARLYHDLTAVCYRAFRVQQHDCDSEQQKDMRARADEVALDLLGRLPVVRDVLATDVQAALHGDPAASSAEEVILSYPGVQAIASHRIAHELYLLGVPMLPRMMSEVTHSRTGIDIHPGANIGASFFIDHGTGLVMGETTAIGTRVKLYQGVTLGALSVRGRDEARGKKRHPTIEDDVTIYAGATILGGETVIGKGSTIGGNVWLTRSVAPGTTVVLDTPSLLFKGK
ncbi:MAG: Serine O-acetyltransferase [Myxococcaceae bacterium]|nr:Serine O-acetyltransferase [Myxococcaceae bacterium]